MNRRAFTPEDEYLASFLHARGCSYRSIGAFMGAALSTLTLYLNPERREAARLNDRKNRFRVTGGNGTRMPRRIGRMIRGTCLDLGLNPGNKDHMIVAIDAVLKDCSEEVSAWLDPEDQNYVAWHMAASWRRNAGQRFRFLSSR